MFASLIINFLPHPRTIEFLGRNFAQWWYFNWLQRVRRTAVQYHNNRLAALDRFHMMLREDQRRS